MHIAPLPVLKLSIFAPSSTKIFNLYHNILKIELYNIENVKIENKDQLNDELL